MIINMIINVNVNVLGPLHHCTTIIFFYEKRTKIQWFSYRILQRVDVFLSVSDRLYRCHRNEVVVNIIVTF